MVLRLIIGFAALVAISLGAVWMAQHSGEIVIDWLGWRIKTSTPVLIIAAILFAMIVALLYRFWRAMVGAPRAFGIARTERRRREGYLALTRGMVALAAGDPEEARRQAKDANGRLDEDEPLTMLLLAQAAQLDGEEGAAKRYFEAMLERPETEFLALRGLMVQSQRARDREETLKLARRAHEIRPKSKWVITELFEAEAAAGNWKAAENLIRKAVRQGAMAGDEPTQYRAILQLQQSVAAGAEGDEAKALKLAREAHKTNPDLLPALIAVARGMLKAGKTSKAEGFIEHAWKKGPHPELAEMYREAIGIKDPLKRVQAIRALRNLRGDHPESHLAMARAALDAKLWGEARRHLTEARNTGTGVGNSARWCRLMAEVEEAEHGNTEAARQWLSKAADAPPDPGWVCDNCGATAPGWNAICGHCGRFGTIDWRMPPRTEPDPAEPLEKIEAKGAGKEGAARDEKEIKALPPAEGEAPKPAASGVADGNTYDGDVAVR